MGETVTMQCTACGAENPESARFCNQCGVRLAASSAYTPSHLRDALMTGAGVQGERKRVTVMFADIKGSTRLAEQAGAELWHQVLDRFFGILAQVVHRYDGTINQYTGDGVMALFGAPRSLEDHAGLAAYAALQMQQEVRRFADELRLAHGLNLSMRVGLNSGEVVVGRIGDDLRADYTAQGPTVNLAARIENLCEPGRVYVTRETAQLLEGGFRLRSLGAMQMAGVDTPVEVVELEGEDGLRLRLQRSLTRSGSPFVGRSAELSRLTAALDQARQGQGQVVAVAGNAGIGKSRLCHEFVEECRRHGITVYRASGVPHASRVPMFPFRHLLRSKLGVSETASAADARRWIAGALLLEDPAHAELLPVLFDFLGIVDASASADGGPAPAPEHMLDELADYLPCSDEPIVLLIEDLHFLDPASEAFLPRLCQRVRGQPCLLLLNHRLDYVSDWLLPLIDESVTLSALGRPDSESLARTLLGNDPSVDALAGIIATRAAGNPYFVEEAVLALTEGGWLEGRPRAWRLLRPVDDWPMPDSVQTLLAARIDRLAEVPRRVLQTAAILGLEFERELLAELEGDDERLRASLQMLEELGFVHERAQHTYAFCHPLMQEVAYRGQLEAHRRRQHAQLARLLEVRAAAPGGEAGEQAPRIAHHWQHAAEWAQAGRWNLMATQWSSTRDLATAEDQVRRALAHFDRAPDDAEGVLRGRIAARASLLRTAQFVPVTDAEIETAYAQASEMAVRSGEIVAQVEVAMSYGAELLHRGEIGAAAKMHEAAIRLCFEHGRTDQINRFRMPVLLSFSATGRLRQIVELLDAAGAGWRTGPVNGDNYLSRGYYGLMLGWMGRLDEATAHLDAALAYSLGDRRISSWIYACSAEVALLRGDCGQALAAAARGVEQSRSAGSPFFSAVALRVHGLALAFSGRHEEAAVAMEAAAPFVAKGMAAHQFEANLLASSALVHALAGRIEVASAAAIAASRSAERSGARVWEMAAWLVRLNLPLGPECREEMVQGLAQAGALIDSSGAEGLRPYWHLAQARWAPDAQAAARHRAQADAAFAVMGLCTPMPPPGVAPAAGTATMRESA